MAASLLRSFKRDSQAAKSCAVAVGSSAAATAGHAAMASNAVRRVQKLVRHLNTEPSKTERPATSTSLAEIAQPAEHAADSERKDRRRRPSPQPVFGINDELDILLRRAEELKRSGALLSPMASAAVDGDLPTDMLAAGALRDPGRQQRQCEAAKFLPFLIVPEPVVTSGSSSAMADNAARPFRTGGAASAPTAAASSRGRRMLRVPILYDVRTSRALQPTDLDVSLDDAATPRSFRYIRIILLTAEARSVQDIHLDQLGPSALSVVFTTQIGVTKPLVVQGAVAASIIYYLGFHDLLAQNKATASQLPPVRDYALRIKVRPHDFIHGTHMLFRVNCIRTNHETGLYHIVMRLLQS